MPNVKTIKCANLKEALDRLENFSSDNFIFRGQNDSKHELASTYDRHYMYRLAGVDAYHMNFFKNYLNCFYSDLHYLGIPYNIKSEDFLGLLEYARHYTLPTPCIDFSHSPYISLFFAFNQTRRLEQRDFVSIYVLDIREFEIWGKNIGFIGDENSKLYIENFLQPSNESLANFFKDGYPMNQFLYIPRPSAANNRMIRQQGALIYDFRTPEKGENPRVKNLEQYMDNSSEQRENPILTKMNLPSSYFDDVMRMLDRMGISGTTLFMDYHGVVMDTLNSQSAFGYDPIARQNRDSCIRQ